MSDIVKNTAEVRRQYRNRIYRFVHERKRTSRHEIAESLGISMPTVLQNVKELIAERLICELGQFASVGGRRAAVLSPVADARFAVGLDITLHHVNLSMVDLLGGVRSFLRVRRPFSTDQEYFSLLENTIDCFVRDSGVDRARILGAGVSLPAIFDKSGENIMTSRILGLTGVPCQMFSGHIPFHCLFINEPNAACTAEMRAIDNRSESYVYVTIGDCIGGAVFIGNRLYEGDTLRSAEFGHMRLHPDGTKCFCGQRGCVNCYLSASVLSDIVGGSLEEFFDQLRAGNPRCAKAWDLYMDDMALLINNLRMSFDCKVILGNEVGDRIGGYMDELHRRLARLNAFNMDVKYVEECRCKKGAASLGAALLQIDRFIAGL